MNYTIIKAWLRDIALLSVLALTIITAVDIYRFQNQVPGKVPESAMLQIQSHLPKNTLQENTPVLLYAWGDWCPICSFTSPQVNQLAKSFPVVSIAMSSGTEHQVTQTLMKSNYHFPAIADEHNILARQLGIRGTPAFFIIDSQGHVYYYSAGASTYFGLYLKLWILQFFI